jgi:competence protein ComEC
MKVLHFPITKITLGFIVGILCTYYWQTAILFNVLGLSTALFFLVLLYINKKNKSTTSILFGVAVYLASFFMGGITLFNNTDSFQKSNYIHHETAFSAPQEIILVVREKLKGSNTNDRYVAIIQTIDRASFSGKIILNIAKDSTKTELITGQYLKIRGTLYKNKETTNPNQFDYGAYLDKKQLYAQLYASSSEIQTSTTLKKDIWYYTDYLRVTIKRNLENNRFSQKELNIAIALLMGQKQDVSADIMQDYQYAGAIHILSVSGLHVGYLMLFLNFILKPIPNTKKGSAIKLIILLSTLTAFAIIAGLSPSVLRSVVMFSFVAIGYQLRRTVNIYHTLLVSALLILLFQPYFIFDVGFQLSYLALFFIVWFQPILVTLFKPRTKLSKYCWTILSVSIAAQLGTLPLSIYYFHQFPGLFFITNLVVAPLLTFIMILGIIVFFLASFGITPIVLVKPLEWSIQGLNSTIHFVASFEQFLIKDIPFNLILLISSYGVIIASIIWIKKPSFYALITTFCFIIIMQSNLLYTEAKIQNENEWIILNSKKNTIVLERHGSKVNVLTNDNLKKTDYSTTLIQSYLVANFNPLVIKNELSNLQYFNKSSILIVDSSGFYIENTNPDILLLTHSPKLNLDRLLLTLKPKQVVADNSNFKNLQKQWEASCKKQKIPFHATAEKGFFKIN